MTINKTKKKGGENLMRDIIAQWNDAAKKYTEDQEQSEYVASNKAVVQKRFYNLKNKKVLDLGCGYGFYTNYFKSIGANVIGVDASKAMLALANQRYPNCDFRMVDMTKTLNFSDESFDMIFCNQVLMDIDDIELVFRECKRLLKPGGIFYYSIVHPAFYDGCWLKNKDGYAYAKFLEKYISVYELTNEFWGKTAHFHRPLSYYLNVASDVGLVLVHVEEPITYDGKSKNKDLPLFFFAEYKKMDI